MAELEEPQIPENSPFHPNNAIGLILLMQMRQYDVLMGILDILEKDYNKKYERYGDHEENSDIIYDAHQNGQVVSGLPFYDPDGGQDG